MAWFPVDDTAHSADAFRRSPLAAAGLYAMAGSWCMDQLTDGAVPAWFVQSWTGGSKAADWLVRRRFWAAVSDGYQFVEWPEFISRKVVEAKRQKNRDKQARWKQNTEGKHKTRPPMTDARQMSAEPIDRLTREEHMTVSDVDADVALRQAAHEDAALRHAAGQVVAAWHSIYPMLALQHGGTRAFTRLAETMTALQRHT